MTYGEKIASLRKQNNITQADLGKKLNVSFQAVSKWENDQSIPDIDTIKKICELFNVSIEEFLDMSSANQPQQTVVHETIIQQTPVVVLGYCEECKKPLYNQGEFVVESHGRGGHTQHIYCNDCKAKRTERQRQEHEAEKAKVRKRGFIWGIVGGVVLAIILLVVGIVQNNSTVMIVGGILGLYGGLSFVSQMIWDNSVCDCMSMFVKSVRLPIIIFTLDLHGILSLIFIKVFGSIVCAILSVLIFLFGLVVTIGYSMLAFPAAVVKQIKGIE